MCLTSVIVCFVCPAFKVLKQFRYSLLPGLPMIYVEKDKLISKCNPSRADLFYCYIFSYNLFQLHSATHRIEMD